MHCNEEDVPRHTIMKISKVALFYHSKLIILHKMNTQNTYISDHSQNATRLYVKHCPLTQCHLTMLNITHLHRAT